MVYNNSTNNLQEGQGKKRSGDVSKTTIHNKKPFSNSKPPKLWHKSISPEPIGMHPKINDVYEERLGSLSRNPESINPTNIRNNNISIKKGPLLAASLIPSRSPTSSLSTNYKIAAGKGRGDPKYKIGGSKNRIKIKLGGTRNQLAAQRSLPGHGGAVSPPMLTLPELHNENSGSSAKGVGAKNILFTKSKGDLNEKYTLNNTTGNLGRIFSQSPTPQSTTNIISPPFNKNNETLLSSTNSISLKLELEKLCQIREVGNNLHNLQNREAKTEEVIYLEKLEDADLDLESIISEQEISPINRARHKGSEVEKNINTHNMYKLPSYSEAMVRTTSTSLDLELTTRLQRIPRSQTEISDNHASTEKIKAYNDTLERIINLDGDYGELLRKIKDGYNEAFLSYRSTRRTTPCSSPNKLGVLQNEIEELGRVNRLLSAQNEGLMGDNSKYKIEIKGLNKSLGESQTQLEVERQKHKGIQNASEELKALNSGLKTQVNILQSDCNSKHCSIEKYKELSNQSNKLEKALLIQEENIQTLTTDLDYYKQREQKLLYLLYLLQKKSCPVQEVFENEVKSIPTAKIQQFIDEKMNIEAVEEIKDSEEMLECKNKDISSKCTKKKQLNSSFDSEASYEPIVFGPTHKPKKPSIVPLLDMRKVGHYYSTSSASDSIISHSQALSEQIHPGNYEGTMEYFENFYAKNGDKLVNEVDEEVREEEYQDMILMNVNEQSTSHGILPDYSKTGSSKNSTIKKLRISEGGSLLSGGGFLTPKSMVNASIDPEFE